MLYIARNPVTIESVRNRIKRALGGNSVSHIEIVDSVDYYFQYLTHESSDAINKISISMTRKILGISMILILIVM